MIMLYLLMIVVKGFYFLTEGDSLSILANVNELMRWIIENTYFPPLNFVWDKIPSSLSGRGDPFLYYKVIIPPMAVMMVSSLFIHDHRLLKKKYNRLKNKIEEEKELHSIRKEAGMSTVSDSATIDIKISNATDSDPLWHNTWWGTIIIGVLITLILVILGLK